MLYYLFLICYSAEGGSSSPPPKQMGMFMGLFNMSITIPQIVNGITGGLILTYVFGGDPLYSIILAGVLMIFGAIATMFVSDKLDLKKD